MVYIILGTGFEEAEAIIPCDLLRRAGVDVKFAGIGALCITGSHGISVTADCIVEDTDLTMADMIGKRAVCYPGMEAEMGSAQMLTCGAVTDGRVITGRAAGTAFDFALELIRALRGEEAAQKVASGIVYRQEV